MKKIINKIFSYQGLRFLFVGGLNTIVGYGIYALLVYMGVNYLIANTLSTIIGIIHSYFWNRYFTFKSKQKALKEITKFVTVYAASYLIGMCTLYIFKSKLNISPYIAGLLNLVITTLISYFGHKYISFNELSKNSEKKTKKLADLLNLSRGPSKLEWGLLIFVLVFCFFSFNHGDLLATSTHGKDLLLAIFEGKFFQFYDYTNSEAVYLIPIYILFAIWSIPVVLIYKLFNIELWGRFAYLDVPYVVLMWYKLLPVLFTVATGQVLVKISKYIGLSEVKQKWILFVFLSCPLLVFSQFIFGQYDSIGMFFTVLALYYYLKKDITKFSILMSISITFKLFALFIFIPLILLSEKRIFYVAKHMIIGAIGFIISNLLFITSPGFMKAKEFTSGMVDRFFVQGIKINGGIVSFFLLIFIAICVYSYITKINKDNKNEFIVKSLFVLSIIYSSFFILILWHPQWIIILVPYLVLLTFMYDNPKATLVLLVSISLSYIFIVIWQHPCNIDESLINLGVFRKILNINIDSRGLLSVFYSHLKVLNIHIWMTVFCSSLIINMLIKLPTKENIKKVENEIKEKNWDVEKGFILMQVFPIFIYIIPVLYVFFKYYV